MWSLILFLMLSLTPPAWAQLLADLAPGQARPFPAYPMDQLPQCRPGTVTDYSRMTYDPVNHQLLLWGGGHAATPRTDVLHFDLTTLTWRSGTPSTRLEDFTDANSDLDNGAWYSTGHPKARHSYDMMPFSPATGELLVLGKVSTLPVCMKGLTTPYAGDGGRVGHYHPQTATWSYGSTAFFTFAASEVDPVSGQILILHANGLERYDPVTRTRAIITKHLPLPIGQTKSLVYSAHDDTFYYFRDVRAVYALMVDRTAWTYRLRALQGITGDLPPTVNTRGLAYDPLRKRIGGTPTAGMWYEFDPATATWSAHRMEAPGWQGALPTGVSMALDYDPAHGLFWFIDTGSRLWAYRSPTLPPPEPVVPPLVEPQDVHAVALSPTTAELYWSAPPDTAVASYTVLQDGQPVAQVPPGAGPYRTTACAPCQAVTFTVRYTAQDGRESPTSAPVSITTRPGRRLQVGPRRPFLTPAQAAAHAQDGDIIEIDADGTYSGSNAAATWKAHRLTLRGVGGRAHLQGGPGIGPKAIWTIQGRDTTVEHLEFSGATVPDKNGAGIRQEGQGLVVRHCLFHHNENGILGGGGKDSHLLIEHTEFAHNGAGDGQSHNLYISDAGSLTVRAVYSHHARVGHLLKSRTLVNTIEYSRFSDEADGTSSYALDFPNGGTATLTGNIIHEGPGSSNHGVVAFAAESKKHPLQALTVRSNTFVSTKPRPVTWLQVGRKDGPPVTVEAVHNLFLGQGTLPRGVGNLSADATSVRDLFALDVRLLPGAPAIDAAAGDPPAHQYVHPLALEPRPRVGAPDVGAYEYSP
jgi:hypothetical protein